MGRFHIYLGLQIKDKAKHLQYVGVYRSASPLEH